MANKSTIVGGKIVAANIVKFTDGFLSAVDKGMEKVKKVLDDRITKNMSLTCHSLKDLARMGHPYSLKNPQVIHSPEYQVHTQSGDLLSGKYSGTEKATVRGGRLEASAFVGISEDKKHAEYVVFGTSRMIPRDFLRGSLNEISGQILKKLKGPLKNAVINFQGRMVRL